VIIYDLTSFLIPPLGTDVTYTETDDGFEIASPVTQAGEKNSVIG